VLQCVAVCVQCVLHCVVVCIHKAFLTLTACWSVLQCVLECVGVRCSVLQCAYTQGISHAYRVQPLCVGVCLNVLEYV